MHRGWPPPREQWLARATLACGRRGRWRSDLKIVGIVIAGMVETLLLEVRRVPWGPHGTPSRDRSTRASCRGRARRARTCRAHSARPPPAASAPARGRAAAPQSSAVGPPIPHVVPVLTTDRDRRAVCRPQALRDGFFGRHARQVARRQVGGRRVGRRRYFSHYFQTIFLCVCHEVCVLVYSVRL